MGLAWVLRLALVGPASSVPAVPEDLAPPVTPASVQLTWNAPPDCGSAQHVQSRIAALLSEAPNGVGEATVVADIERDAGGVRMVLTTNYAGSTDVREVASTSCGALVEATALLLAVSLEPGLERERVSATEPDADREVESPASPVEVLVPPVLPELPGISHAATVEPSPELEVPAQRPRTWRLYGLAGAGLERGAVQDLTGTLRLGLGAGGRRWASEVLGSYMLPRRQPEGLFQAGVVGARGCWTPGAEAWQALLCGGAEFGGLRVDSRGLEPGRTRRGPYVGPAASVGVLRRQGRVGFVLRAEAMVRALGSRTVDESDAVLSEQRVLSIRLTAGLQFDLLAPRP